MNFRPKTWSLALCCACLLSSVSAAAIIEWDDGGIGRNWTAFLNWSPNFLPGAGDDVLIGTLAAANGDATIIGQDFTINSLGLSNFASANTSGNRLTVGDIDLGQGSQFIVERHHSGLAALQTSGITVDNIAKFIMDGGHANIGGSVLVQSGGEFTGHGTFNFTNGLSSQTTVFVNNGNLSTSRPVGAAPNERFTLSITANDNDAVVDLDGTTNNGLINIANNTTLDVGLNPIIYLGTMNFEDGAIFNADGFVSGSGSTFNINGGSAAVTGSQWAHAQGDVNIAANSNLIVNSNTFSSGALAHINLSSDALLQFNSSATIESSLTLGAGSSIIIGNNSDLSINRADFDWDGPLGDTATTVLTGGTLVVTADSPDSGDGQYHGTVDVRGGTLDTNFSTGAFVVGNTGELRFDSSSGAAELTGDDLQMFGTLRASGTDFAFIEVPTTFESGSATIVEAGSNTQMHGTVSFKGATSHTGSGSLRFDRDINVTGATTIDMATGIVELDNRNGTQTANLGSDLTVNAASLDGEVGDAGGGVYTINIDNTDSTLTVNLTNPVAEWALGEDGILNVSGSSTVQTSLAGSDLNVRGRINVNDSTRFTSRLDIESTGFVSVNDNVLNLDGGSQQDPNRLLGGTIAGPSGTLRAFNTALHGYGTVEPRISFLGGSDLVADGGTLNIQEEITGADVVKSNLGSTLVLDHSLQTGQITALVLDGGNITAAGITNGGITRGHGSIDSDGFVNDGSLIGEGGGALSLTTNAPIDLDGISEIGTVHAASSDVIVNSELSDSFFDGTIVADAGWAVEIAETLQTSPDGHVQLNGSASEAATFRSSLLSLFSTLQAQGIGRLEARTIFHNDAIVGIASTSDRLILLESGTTISPDATFSGNGLLVNESPLLNLSTGSNIGVGLLNSGTIVNGSSALGSFSVLEFSQTETGGARFEIGGIDDHDQMQVTGSLFLRGELEATLSSGYMPMIGDEFQIITSSSLNGQFDTLTLPGLSGNLAWQVDYSDTMNVWLRVIASMISGDFDGNGDYACNDIDMLVAEVVAGTNNIAFDLTGDGTVNTLDVDAWLTEAGAAEIASGNAYLQGDANLDGTVDGLDFIDWNANKFTSLASWCGGDFNADGTVDGLDFIIWNTNKFTSADSYSAVPEPSVWVLPLMGAIAISRVHTVKIA